MGFFERMKKYNYNDVIEIYASCGHMCYTFSYNFDLNKSGDKVLESCVPVTRLTLAIRN